MAHATRTAAEPRYYTVAQVARQLQLNPETVRVWLRNGQLRGTRIGCNRAGWRIQAADLEGYLHPRPQADDEEG